MFGVSYLDSRRSFLTGLGAISGLAFLSPDTRRATREATIPPVQRSGEWDLTWLDDLKGKHKQVFDLSDLTGPRTPLHVIKNYLNAHRDVYGLAFPDINTIVGIAGATFPINASDPVPSFFAAQNSPSASRS